MWKAKRKKKRKEETQTAPYDYPIEHIYDLLSVVKLRKMSAPADFFLTPTRELQRCYNGIGPESWAPKFRNAMTRLLNWLEAPALIHDYEFEYSARTYRAFSKANLRLIGNSWKDGRFRIGLAAGILCQLGGWRCYKEGRGNDQL